MDRSVLARKMLRWEELQRELRQLEREIQEAVLALGESVTVGNVRATYYRSRRKFDYEAVAKQAPPDVIEACTETRVNWRKVYELALERGLSLPQPPYTESPPRVVLKLLEVGGES